jgi:hypothetical protein
VIWKYGNKKILLGISTPEKFDVHVDGGKKGRHTKQYFELEIFEINYFVKNAVLVKIKSKLTKKKKKKKKKN